MAAQTAAITDIYQSNFSFLTKQDLDLNTTSMKNRYTVSTISVLFLFSLPFCTTTADSFECSNRKLVCFETAVLIQFVNSVSELLVFITRLER